MPAASAFNATYLDPPSGSLYTNARGGTIRFQVANAVKDLTNQLGYGMSAANAQAQVAAKARHDRSLWRAADVLNSNQIVTDFQAITTP